MPTHLGSASLSSPNFTLDALPATTLSICPDLGQVQEYAGWHTHGLVACPYGLVIVLWLSSQSMVWVYYYKPSHEFKWLSGNTVRTNFTSQKHDEQLKNKCSAVAEMGDRLATIDISRKVGAVPLSGSPCHTMSPGPWPTYVRSGILINPAIWPQQTWAENWGSCAL